MHAAVVVPSWRFALLGLIAAAVLACGGGGKKSRTDCTSDGECGGGACFEGECYTACTAQQDCGEDEYCVRRQRADGTEADICLVASEFAGCIDDAGCSELVQGACEQVFCDLAPSACAFRTAPDGLACPMAGGTTGSCVAGACLEILADGGPEVVEVVPEADGGFVDLAEVVEVVEIVEVVENVEASDVTPDPGFDADLDACVIDCLDRQCGDDGCGGSCGECPGGSTCQDGVCLAVLTGADPLLDRAAAEEAPFVSWTVDLLEDFEEQSPGAQPSGWVPLLNAAADPAGNLVLDDPDGAGSQLLQLTARTDTDLAATFLGLSLPTTGVFRIAARLKGSGLAETTASALTYDVGLFVVGDADGHASATGAALGWGAEQGDDEGLLALAGLQLPAVYHEWLSVDLVVDADAREVSAYLGGEYVATAPLAEGVPPPWRLAVSAGGGMGWVDDVGVFSLVVPPAGAGDGVADDVDNCPTVYNPDQADLDDDGQGNRCDPDDDGDGTVDAADCAPADAVVHPGASETCNAIDDDCDGQTDEDCQGCTPSGLGEAACDGVDDDCDGQTDEDFAGGASSCGLGACAATGVTECVGGEVHDTCAPGTPAATDATCDDVDDDCDGDTDEGYVGPSVSCGVGACAVVGTSACVGGVVEPGCVPGVPAASDGSCDGSDDDCDGATDEDYVPTTVACDAGSCLPTGTTACLEGVETSSCSTSGPGGYDPVCNGVDDDCDGQTDEDYLSLETTCGVGACAAVGQTACVDGAEVDSCASGTPASDDVTCDGVDDDCNGLVDDGVGHEVSTCGEGTCRSTGQTSCLDGLPLDSCVPGAPADEACNGADDDCDGTVDDGCDDDVDGWCDAALALEGTPAACPSGGGDCDDGDAATHPGAVDVAAWACTQRVDLATRGDDPTALATQTVDATGDVGSHVALAVDGAGRLVASYHDATAKTLKVARRAQGTWTTQVVDATTGRLLGRSTSLAVTPDGVAFVAYWDETSGSRKLKAATNATGAWTTSDVDSLEGAGLHPSLALDPAGHPHVTYYVRNGSYYDLRHAADEGAGWAVETIDGGSDDQGWHSALAVGADGTLHVAYLDWAGDLRYATRAHDGTAWTFGAAIDTLDATGWDPTLALDAGGVPHVVYLSKTTTGDVRHAWPNVDGVWTTEVLATGVFVDTYNNGTYRIGDKRAAFDAAGRLNVAVLVGTSAATAQPRLLVRSPEGVVTGITLADKARYLSLAADAWGGVFAAYYATASADLVVADSACLQAGTPADDNCDGVDGTDADADGHASTTTGGDDCDDARPLAFPGAAEACNGLDDGCNGVVDDGEGSCGELAVCEAGACASDLDSDAIADAGDNCPDAANADQADLDLDAQGDACDPDADGDTYPGVTSDGSDCDDLDATVHPDASDGVAGFCLEWSASSFTPTDLDTWGDVGLVPEAVTTASGAVYVAYLDGPNKDVRYATDADGTWRTHSVDTRSQASTSVAVAVDGQRRVHLLYYDSRVVRLLYTRVDGTAEQHAVVEASSRGAVGGYSLAVDGAGVPHAAFYDNSAHDLYYATLVADEWKTEVVEAAANVGYDTAVAVDASGVVHVFYLESASPYRLKHAFGHLGAWSFETVDEDVRQFDLDVVAAADGTLHLLYQEDVAGHVAYRAFADGTWSAAEVVDAGAASLVGSLGLAVAPDGSPRATWVVPGYYVGEIYLGTRSTSGSWSQVHVATAQPTRVTLAAPADDRVLVFQDNDLSYDSDLRVYGNACARVDLDVDGNCDGVDGIDADGDGIASVASGGSDCDDALSALHPGAPDALADGVDADCDGIDGVDADGDGFAAAETFDGVNDCHDGDPGANPAAVDLADGVTSLDVPFLISDVATTGSYHYAVTAALDADGWMHAVWDESKMVYATNRPASPGGASVWRTEALPVSVGRLTTLMPAADGTVHVLGTQSQNLVLLTRGAAGWTSETIDASGKIYGGRLGLFLDGQGYLHAAACTNSAATGIHYVTNRSGAWVVETVPTSTTPWSVGVTATIDGTVHLVTDAGSGVLALSRRDGEWTEVRVDSDTGADWIAVAADAHDAVHAVYYATGSLRHATNAGGRWQVQTLDTDGMGTASGGPYPALVVSENGEVVVSYQDYDRGDLKLVTNRGGRWQQHLVDEWGAAGSSSGLGVDALGRVHVVYEFVGVGGSPYAQDVRYAVSVLGDGADRDCDRLDGDDDDFDGHASQASGGDDCDDAADLVHPGLSDATVDGLDQNCNGLDGDGIPVDADLDHDAHAGDDCDDLDPLSHPGAFDAVLGDCDAWRSDAVGTSIVDTLGNVGYYPSVAVDAAGNLYVAYAEQLPNSYNLDLKVATNRDGAWRTERVDAVSSTGKYASIAVNAVGHVAVAYYDDLDLDLKVARRMGGPWIIERVDATGDVGQGASCALDASDRVYVSYYDATNSALKLAIWDKVWSTSTVDNSGADGLVSSLAVDGAGTVAIAYVNWINDVNKRARFALGKPGAWAVADLTTTGAQGLDPSLARDATGAYHLTWRNNDTGYAVYTRSSDGVTWSPAATVAALATNGGSQRTGDHRLALDPQNRPFIVLSTYASSNLVKLAEADAAVPTRWTLTDVASGGAYGVSLAVDGLGHYAVAHDQGSGDLLALEQPACQRWGTAADADCDGLDGVDADEDGAASVASGGDDCDDTLASIHPQAADSAGDGIDQDCDGLDGIDADRDRYASVSSGGDDCDDADPEAHPGVQDLELGVCAGSTTFDTGEISALDVRRHRLQVGPDGALHWAYTAYVNGMADGVEYRVHRDGAWSPSEVVDTVGRVGEYLELAVDADGMPHVVYYMNPGSGTGTFYYATRTGPGTWARDVLFAGDSTASAIAVHPDGSVAVAWVYSGAVHVRTRPRLGDGTWAAWTADTVLSGIPTSVKDVELRIDTDGLLHLVYLNGIAYYTELRHATLALGASTATDELVRTIPGYTYADGLSAVLDGAGRVRAFYFQASDANLEASLQQAGGTWTTQILDASYEVGRVPIAVQAATGTYVAYWDATNRDYKLATDRGGTWETLRLQTRASSTAADEVPFGLAVLPNGQVHAVYHGYVRDSEPWATHVRHAISRCGDARDLNCDGVPAPTKPSVAGQVIVTEFMARSVLNVDDFEWVELTNVTDQTVDLGGCELRDAGSDVHTIAGSLVAAPNTPLLLVRTASETEYGKAPDYVYGTSFGLGNTGDEITLRCDGVTIDTVTYTSSWVVLGTSQQLSGTSFDAASNDAMSNWCPGTATYNAVPKYGTPGSANHDCSNP